MKVLIIEDEHKLANTLKRGLQQESFAVDVSYDADDGLKQVSKGSYDILIIDRMTPSESDGVAVIKAIREQKNHTPILLLASRDDPKDRIVGLDAGADDYLVKPFAFQELLSRVRTLIGQIHLQPETTLQYDDLTLDSMSYEVTRNGRRIKLSNKEFALLEFMIRNPERILTKENIISHVWNYDADILPNTVEVYIRYLRNKIDKPFPDSPVLIHTARGFGYKLSKED